MSVPKHEVESRQLLKLQAQQQNKGDCEVKKCNLPFGGVLFYQDNGDINKIASNFAQQQIRGDAVIIPAGYHSTFTLQITILCNRKYKQFFFQDTRQASLQSFSRRVRA